MGGSSSGMYRTRNRGTLNASMRLDVRYLRRRGFVKPGAVTSGVLRWNWAGSDQELGAVSISVNLADPNFGSVTVRFSLDDEPRVQEIDLVSRPMRFGGRRYYFRCPKHRRLCEVLAMVEGVFASRQAQRLTYQSQSQTDIDRLRDRADRLEKRLWPEDRRHGPRGQNRERLFAAWEAADSGFLDMFAARVTRRFGKFL